MLILLAPSLKDLFPHQTNLPSPTLLEILEQRTEAVKYRGKYFGSD